MYQKLKKLASKSLPIVSALLLATGYSNAQAITEEEAEQEIHSQLLSEGVWSFQNKNRSLKNDTLEVQLNVDVYVPKPEHYVLFSINPQDSAFVYHNGQLRTLSQTDPLLISYLKEFSEHDLVHVSDGTNLIPLKELILSTVPVEETTWGRIKAMYHKP